MKQEQKELLLKDLCARLPYGVVIQEKCLEHDKIFLPNEESNRLINIDVCDGTLMTNGGSFYRVEEVKPYLFPLSSMTIEQERELSKLGVSYGEYALHDDIRGLGIMVDEAYIFFEYCYKHHIDFLGLIEMGLAINATGKSVY